MDRSTYFNDTRSLHSRPRFRNHWKHSRRSHLTRPSSGQFPIILVQELIRLIFETTSRQPIRISRNWHTKRRLQFLRTPLIYPKPSSRLVMVYEKALSTNSSTRLSIIILGRCRSRLSRFQAVRYFALAGSDFPFDSTSSGLG